MAKKAKKKYKIYKLYEDYKNEYYPIPKSKVKETSDRYVQLGIMLTKESFEEVDRTIIS